MLWSLLGLQDENSRNYLYLRIFSTLKGIHCSPPCKSFARIITHHSTMSPVLSMTVSLTLTDGLTIRWWYVYIIFCIFHCWLTVSFHTGNSVNISVFTESHCPFQEFYRSVLTLRWLGVLTGVEGECSISGEGGIHGQQVSILIVRGDELHGSSVL